MHANFHLYFMNTHNSLVWEREWSFNLSFDLEWKWNRRGMIQWIEQDKCSYFINACNHFLSVRVLFFLFLYIRLSIRFVCSIHFNFVWRRKIQDKIKVLGSAAVDTHKKNGRGFWWHRTSIRYAIIPYPPIVCEWKLKKIHLMWINIDRK